MLRAGDKVTGSGSHRWTQSLGQLPEAGRGAHLQNITVRRKGMLSDAASQSCASGPVGILFSEMPALRNRHQNTAGSYSPLQG
ncbi:Interleukin-6 Receptor Subunit Beta [Manis pentadactyla]|nr:Interleukin-6 Receptor Subunit Beta [Manis pentadactyla]